MPIAVEDGYHVTHDLAHVTCVGIESERLDACVARVKRDQTRGVFGNPRYGFVGYDLDFLAALPWIEAVWFWDVELKSVEGLYALRDLQHFGVHPKRPPIDFSRFPGLRKAIVEPRARDQGLGTLTALDILHLWHFRPKDRTLSSLELPKSLVELQINWANSTSLDTLPTLPRLRRLEVHRCRNLESLGDLGVKFPNLQHLVVSACGKVMHGEGERVVRELPHLVHAYVRDAKLV